jgi:hypothetical protein
MFLVVATALEEKEPPGSRKAEHLPLPWDLEKEYRYLWIQGSQKVGETRFRIQKGIEGEKPVLHVTARRSHDSEKASQRARGSTTLYTDGTPLNFEESLEFSTVRQLKAHQVTSISFSGNKARVKYVQNGKEDTAVIYEAEVPPGAFLFANQAVEHWAVFTSKLPSGAEEHDVQLFFPDFRKTFEVSFQSKARETLTLGDKKVAATRYTFSSSLGELKGSIWLDSRRRLVQVEFPPASPELRPLKVVLVPD